MVGGGLTLVMKLIKAGCGAQLKSFMALRLHLITLRVEGCGSFSKIGYYSVNCARTFLPQLSCAENILAKPHGKIVRRYLRTTHVSSFFSYLKRFPYLFT